MSNLDLWQSVEDIDPKFTKPITGRDYQGTSPNPQYLIKLATEKLGPVGKGFGWRIVDHGFEKLLGTTLHWCRIEFWWRETDGGEKNFIEQYGQTKAAYITNAGKERVDEDAPKKSLTDAVVKALSHLGFAANIFLGRWDDQKYVDAVNEDYRAAERQAEADSFDGAGEADRLLDALKHTADCDLGKWKATNLDAMDRLYAIARPEYDRVLKECIRRGKAKQQEETS